MKSSRPPLGAALALGLGLCACQPTPKDPPPAPPPREEKAERPPAPPPPAPAPPEEPPKDPLAPAVKPPLPPKRAEPAPPPSPRAAGVPEADLLRTRIEGHFQGAASRRLYVQTDKPLYKPGETIWLKLWDLRARTLTGDHGGQGAIIELVSPRGAVVQKRKVREQDGGAPADFPLGPGIAGGEYTLRVRTLDGHRTERPVMVSSYEAPRLQMKLEFLRKAYGAGDEVSATVAVRRATGEPLRDHPLSGLVRLDGQDLPRVQLRTDDQGEGLLRFPLPASIAVGDGLLTLLAEDGGLTESLQKRVPIVVSRLSLSTFPEGGHLVEGLPGRVYFEAKSPLGKPADITGRVLDDRGQLVSQLQSVRDGLGRFELLPSPGRSYHIEIDRPAGIAERYPLPLPLVSGCALRSFDDLDGELSALRVAVRCSAPQRVIVVATLRENLLDAAAVEVPGGAPAIVYLEPKDPALARAQGAARVTVFDEKLSPLAERLVYRNRRARLGVKIEPERKVYGPREQVLLRLETKDPAGQPVPAELGLSVVDDTVLTFADDKTGHMLSRLYLEPELGGEVEEPNFYFDLAEEKSALALDLLMGTRGWRRFEWQPLLRPGAQLAVQPAARLDFGGLRRRAAAAAEETQAEKKQATSAPRKEEAQALAQADPKPERPAEPPALPADRPPPMALAQAPTPARPAAAPQPVMAERARAAEAPRRDEASPRAAPAEAERPMGGVAPGLLGRMEKASGEGRGAGDLDREPAEAPPANRKAERDMNADKDGLLDDRLPGALAQRRERPRLMMVARPRPPEGWAPVRVFPQPVYKPDYDGPRNDFRETILFVPSVRTDRDGRAEVRFFLSDAITSFRVTGEGVGAGAAGRAEAIVKSSLPFSMAVKVPSEVSEGDELSLPLVLTNERERPLQVDLSASFGDLLRLDRPVQRTQGVLAAGAREALFYPLTVVGKKGRSTLRFSASASGLRDEFEREIAVTPRGFPQHLSRSGQIEERAVVDLDLGDLLPGTADGKLRLYPSPVASMVAGLEGLLREPGGCFEQASSIHYPNVMILQYLQQQRQQDPGLLARASRLLGVGYQRLVGYETPQRGYEWFGAAPANEALTAYGLLEFTDMKEVYPDVDRAMLQRTAAWLRGRRDGKGGYHRDGKALDSFGRASKEVTDAYITYSLAEARQTGIDEELAAAERLGRESGDAYVLALSAGSLLAAGRREAGLGVVARLVSLQDPGGGFLKANHSITRSGGEALHIETTALALLALLKAGGQDEAVRRAVEWLMAHRGGYGQFGSTQATVLALKALTAYAIATRRTQAPGDVTLLVNGQVVAKEHYEAGRRAPLVFGDLDRHLRAGKNRIELQHQGKAPLPYSLGLDYRALRPASSPKAAVGIEARLERDRLPLGESVRMNVLVRNRTDAGQPMTLVRVGVPGGLLYQTWQLKELRDKGVIAFYETAPREVNLYLREMRPREEVRIPIDLLAAVPGRYTGPASRAYLYYTNEHKSWTDGVTVTITP